MKKTLFCLLVFLFATTMSVYASEPIVEGKFDIIIEDCEDFEEDEGIFFDILVKKDSVLDNDFSFSNEVNQYYIDLFPQYENHNFLINGEYYSYTAYYKPLSIYKSNECKYVVEPYIALDSDFYFIVFKKDGTLLIEKLFRVDEVGYSSDYKHYTTLKYVYADNEINLITKRRLNGSESILVPFIVISGSIVLISGIVISKRFARKHKDV